MRLGAGPLDLAGLDRPALRALAEQAVASSFDALWFAESRATGTGGALAAAAMVAQWVPIRVGAAVDAGLYHPLHLAEDIAVADLTSQGRIEVLLRFEEKPDARYPVPAGEGWHEEWLQVLALALDGAHVRFDGQHIQVPARLDANRPRPERLAVSPRPAQPVVPVWVAADRASLLEVARGLGFGSASRRLDTGSAPRSNGRWPEMILCEAGADPDGLLGAAGDEACYFVVAARTRREVEDAGRRLAGPLRMPEFPDWILS